MSDEARRHSDSSQSDDYVKGGKGRKDEVGKSGIYPASSTDAPADAEVRTEGELARHRGAHRKSTDEREIGKGDVSSGSE
jgi:hypothetical protein